MAVLDLRERDRVGAGVDLLGGAFLEEDRVKETDDRQVEDVDPHHGVWTGIVVLVEAHRRGENEVAAIHADGVAVDMRPNTASGEHEAQCRRRVAVGRRELVRAQELGGSPQAVGGVGGAGQARVRESQDAAVTPAIDRHQFDGALAELHQLTGPPTEGDHARDGRRGEEALELPQRLEVVFGEVCVELVQGGVRR